MRFLEYLLEDSQDAAIAFRSGVLVNVPDPARAMPEKFQSQLAKGIEWLPASAGEAVKAHFGGNAALAH